MAVVPLLMQIGMPAGCRILLLAGSMIACQTGPQGYRSAKAPGSAIITAAEARRYELVPRPISMAFGPGRNGTELVLEFIRYTRTQGYLYIGEISISLLVPRNGMTQSCTTRILPEHEYKVRYQQVWKPGQTERKRVYKPVTRMVTENVYGCQTVTERPYRCKSVQRMVTEYETYWTTEYDYFSKKNRSVQKRRPRTRYKTEQQCGMEPETKQKCGYTLKTHSVTRYEYQWETHYVPPQLETIARQYSQWKLIETPPVCSPITGPAQNTISGVAYYRPDAAPATINHGPPGGDGSPVHKPSGAK